MRRFTSRGSSLAFALFGSFLLLLQRVEPRSVVEMLLDQDYAFEQAPRPRLYYFDQESIPNPSLKFHQQQPEEQGELPILPFHQEDVNNGVDYDEQAENGYYYDSLMEV